MEVLASEDSLTISFDGKINCLMAFLEPFFEQLQHHLNKGLAFIATENKLETLFIGHSAIIRASLAKDALDILHHDNNDHLITKEFHRKIHHKLPTIMETSMIKKLPFSFL